MGKLTATSETPAGKKDSSYYDAAYEKAAAVFIRRDPPWLCRRSGARMEGETLRIRYFEKEYAVSLEDAAFHPDDLPVMEKILVLHYLSGEEGAGGDDSKGIGDGGDAAEPASAFISYDALPNGMFYKAAFRRFGPAILLKTFGEAPEAAAAAAERLGGVPERLGDCSVRIPVFPRVEVIVVMHRGDEELPPEANILFGDDIADYLSLEDISRLGGIAALRLAKYHRATVAENPPQRSAAAENA